MSERKYDDTEKDSFPASDPPAHSGTTGPEHDEKPKEGDPVDAAN